MPQIINKVKTLQHDHQHLNENLKVTEQEAQLSQTGCAMPRVTEYFAKSLEVIQCDTLEYGMCK